MKKYLICIWAIVCIVILTICMSLLSVASMPANIIGVILFGVFVALSVETNCFTKNIFKK
jgi:hypothetical protein